MSLLKLFLLLITCLLPLAGCRGCGGAPEDGDQQQRGATGAPSGEGGVVPASAPSGVLSLPKGPWTDLAHRLVDARDLGTAVGATREVLARGGVATFDGDRDIVEAIAPRAGFQATPLETIRLAREARRRRTAATMTAAELAQMLQTFGWPFKDARDDGRDEAAEPFRGRMTEDLQDAARAGRAAERDQASSARGESEAAIEADQQAARDREEELMRGIQQATLAWQKARQAVGKAPAGAKAEAEAQVKQAWDARNALIAERAKAGEAARAARDDRRARARADEEEARRMETVRRSIGPDYHAGEQLIEMLATWVRAAAENPNDPRSFTPLFLAEMARLQDPPFDLAGSRFTRPGRGDGSPTDLRGAPRSQQLRLTLLEIQLLAASFFRGPDATRTSINGDARRLTAAHDMFPPVVRVRQDPCSDFKKSLGELVDKVGGNTDAVTGVTEGAGAGASELVGRGLDKAIGAALDPADAAAFGKAMGALSLAARIGKLASFYNDNQVTVTPERLSTHKPPEGPPLVSYTATAGISEGDWKNYENAMKAADAKVDRALRDCMNNLGLPTAAEVADLAKEAENWLIEWRLTDGSPPHAWISLANNDFFLPGRMAMKLKRTGPYSASSKFTVDILPEAKRTGKIVRAYVTAQASVDAAGMPSLGTLINVLKGGFGLADALLELCVGWYQFMNMPKAYGTVEVEYHCPKPTTLVPGNNTVADGGGDDGPDDCLLEAGSR